MAEDGAQEENRRLVPEVAGRTSGAASSRRRLRWHYLAEAMREIGALSMVFAALDWTLYSVRISMAGILVWIFGGLAVLLIGIYVAPEAQG